MIQQRPIYQCFPGRHGSDQNVRVGALFFHENGEIHIQLDAYPAPGTDSKLVALVDASAFTQPSRGLPGHGT